MNKTNRPLIGLTASTANMPDWGAAERGETESQGLPADNLPRLYAWAVARAGGLPVIIPPIKEAMISHILADDDDDDFFPLTNCGPQPLHVNAKVYLERLDGLVLTGGGDIGPSYTQTPSPLLRNLDRLRDNWETALLGVALDLKKPVLGICRGLQIINAALGGTLWNDLPAERPGPVNHEQKTPRKTPSHSVRVEQGTILAGLAGQASELMVNSSHHQGINQLAPSLKASAFSADGLIEAIERPQGSFLLALQWHPEALPEDAASRAVFNAFLQASNKN